MQTEIIIKFIVTVIGAILTAFVIPWIRQEIDTEKLERFLEYIELAVRSAEQIFKDNKEKKQYVYDYILKKSEELGLNMTPADIDLMIEGAVNLIKKGE